MRVAKDERADNHSALLQLLYVPITQPTLGLSLTDDFVLARARSRGKRGKVKGVKNECR